jgi:hypothetical protein
VSLSIVSVSGELIEKRELGEISPGSYEEEINLGSQNSCLRSLFCRDNPQNRF